MPSNQSPQAFLSEAVRTKMIKDLAGKASGWVYFVVTVSSGFVLQQFVGEKSLHLLWMLLIGAIAGSQWEEFQKRKLGALDDQLLQLLHNEFQGKRAVSRLLTGLGVAAVLAFVAIVYLAKHENFNPQASDVDCAVEQVEVEPFVFVLNEQPDAGYIVKARIANSESPRVSWRLVGLS